MIKVKCISPRLNHVAFEADGKGIKKPRKIQVGDVFRVKAIPKAWADLVVDVEAAAVPDLTKEPSGEKEKVTNPEKGAKNPSNPTLDQLRELYEERTGDPAPKNWSLKKLQEVMQ